MLSYCVKQRKMTECVPGSEVIVKLKNGRDMMKCINFVKNVALLKLNSLKNKISFKKDFICNDTYGFFNYCDKGERKTCPF